MQSVPKLLYLIVSTGIDADLPDRKFRLGLPVMNPNELDRDGIPCMAYDSDTPVTQSMLRHLEALGVDSIPVVDAHYE